jgi:hypothetical protein
LQIMPRLALLVLLFTGSGYADSSDAHLGGYVEGLSSVVAYPFMDGRLYDQALQSRLNSTWNASGSLRGELDIRTRLFLGSSVEKIPGFLERMRTDYAFDNLDIVLWHDGPSLGYAQIDRFWLDYARSSIDVSMGRQRVAWGTALVWNVIDLFNPKSVLDFDYEEMPGTDALRVQYYTGVLSKLEFVAEPAHAVKRATVAAMFSTNLSQYDLYGMAGVRDNRWLIGGAWAGSVLAGGFRGELLYSQRPDKSMATTAVQPPVGDDPIAASNASVLSLVLSGDYTMSTSLYIHTEVLYNSIGRTSNTGLYQQGALDAHLLSAARWSLYQELAYDITPLSRGTLFVIWNPNDESGIVVPSLTRSLKSDLDLLLIGLFAFGTQSSEYGQAGDSFYVRFRFSY